MKCQILFPAKNKKNVSKCRLLQILPRALSVYTIYQFIKPFLDNKMSIFEEYGALISSLFTELVTGTCLCFTGEGRK